MTSSENLASFTAASPWSFRDPWFSDIASRENETLAKAIQKSFTTSITNNINIDTTTNTNNNNNSVSEAFVSDFIPPFVNPETPTASNVSGSDPETTLSKRQRSAVSGPNSGKISKRKSRASKRTQTTFITADPSNFRQMVQQVTGVRFGNSQVAMAPILKPEPQRPGGRLSGLNHAGGCLPTLDTSAFLLDHHHQPQVMMGPGSGPVTGPVGGPGPFSFQTSVIGDGANSGLDFDTFSSFPTLESWKVM